MLINLLPDFLAVVDAANPEAAYQQYRDAHRPVLDAYWHNYVLDPDSSHADAIVANALKAPRDDLRALVESADLTELAEEAIRRAEELLQIDRYVRRNTVERFGPVREVVHDPDQGLVLEVAFEGLARSTRHKSGLAMRFPRINRLRWDKPPGEADRLETLERMLEQIERGRTAAAANESPPVIG